MHTFADGQPHKCADAVQAQGLPLEPVVVGAMCGAYGIAGKPEVGHLASFCISISGTCAVSSPWNTTSLLACNVHLVTIK